MSLPFCHFERSEEFVMPVLSPLLFPPGSLLSFPPGSPLSFPQGFSANPVSFSSVLFIRGGPAWEKPMDSRLKMSGMTEGGIVSPRFSFCHSRRVLAGIQCFSLLFLSFVGGLLGKTHGFPIKDVGNDRGGIKEVGHDRGGINNVGHDGGGENVRNDTGQNYWRAIRGRAFVEVRKSV